LRIQIFALFPWKRGEKNPTLTPAKRKKGGTRSETILKERRLFRMVLKDAVQEKKKKGALLDPKKKRRGNLKGKREDPEEIRISKGEKAPGPPRGGAKLGGFKKVSNGRKPKQLVLKKKLCGSQKKKKTAPPIRNVKGVAGD